MASIREQMQTVMHARDGEDHINLSVGGRTQIGRMSALAWNRHFFIPHLGEFAGPRSFVQWIASGDDNYRASAAPGRVSGMTSNDYHTLLLFAKYFQMTSFAGTIRKERDALSLPWVAYKQFNTGVRQYDVWSEYCGVAREYADFIVNNEAGGIFPWAKLYPEVLPIVNKYLQRIVEAQGTTFVPFEELILEKPSHGRGKPRSARPRSEGYRKNSFEGAGSHTFEKPAVAVPVPVEVPREDRPLDPAVQEHINHVIGEAAEQIATVSQEVAAALVPSEVEQIEAQPQADAHQTENV